MGRINHELNMARSQLARAQANAQLTRAQAMAYRRSAFGASGGGAGASGEPNVFVGRSTIPGAGRGVFAARDYQPCDLIEVPLITAVRLGVVIITTHLQAVPLITSHSLRSTCYYLADCNSSL